MRRGFTILLISIIFISCEDDTQVNTIRGQLFGNCDSPLALGEVALRSTTTDRLILGGAVADARGDFVFTYELEDDIEGNGELIYASAAGSSILLKEVPLNEDIENDLYLVNSATVILSLSGSKNFTVNDTLIYHLVGFDSDGILAEQKIVAPQNGVIDTLSNDVILTYPNLKSLTLNYGIGTADYSRSVEASNLPDSTYQNIIIPVSGCKSIDQYDLRID